MSAKYTKNDYIDYIKLQLTAGVLELEVSDEIIGKFIDAALVELRRFIDESKLVTVPFSRCIDLKNFDHSAIVHVYRTHGFAGNPIDAEQGQDISLVDPMYAQQWMVFSAGAGGYASGGYSTGGYNYNLEDYVMNYLSYSTLQQMRNTLSTDLAFKEDKHGQKLYINCTDAPGMITIEYIPVYRDVEEITSDYWIDILKKLSLALCKIGIGRVRTRFTQSNALWTQDGDRLLEEGNTEYKELIEKLSANACLFYPID